jgi:hypothetical protein
MDCCEAMDPKGSNQLQRESIKLAPWCYGPDKGNEHRKVSDDRS